MPKVLSKKYFIFIILLFLLFRIPGLGNDLSNTDALRWHRRSERFLTAIKTGDFKGTYQHYQPGVTIMWINSVVKQVTFTTQHRILGIEQPKTLENADWYPIIHGISKIVLVTVLCGLLALQVFILNKLFGEKVAYIFGFLMAIEPYMVGMDRWFHLTSLETYFAFLSLLAMLWWQKENREKLLVLSGAFLALSALSKITTLLIVPLLLFIVVSKNYKKILKNVSIFSISALGIFLLLFPALIADPAYIFNDIFLAGKEAVVASTQISHLEKVTKTLFYVLIMFYKLSPLVIFAFLFSFCKRKEILENKSLKLALIYALFYLVSLTIAHKKIDRYVIVMFPPLILIVSYYLSLLNNKALKNILIAGFLFTIVSTFIYYPVFSAYNSPILGGTKTAISLGLYDNSGEYLADAARYLNQKGRDVKVYVPNGSISFFSYYKGERVNSLEERPDYVVVSHDLERQEIDNFGCEIFEVSFGSKEMDVVFVFRCE